MDIQLGIHWPYCIDRSCIGCMPGPAPSPPEPEAAPVQLPDLSAFFRPIP